MSFAPFQSGLKSDGCGLSQRNVENASAANYILDKSQCGPGLNRALLFATEQPVVSCKGGYQVGGEGHNIGVNSELLVTDLSKTSEKLSLQQSMFATSPFLGRGYIDTEAETDMRNMPFRQNCKSLNPSSEVSYDPYSKTPMLPCLKHSIQNPANLIEPIAQEGWQRGGMSSRAYEKERNYDIKR